MNVQRPRDATSLLPETFARWFAQRDWTPRAHQLELLAKARAGRSVLLIAPTGAGKTLAGFLASLVELSEQTRRALGAPSPLAGEGGPRVQTGYMGNRIDRRHG
jgi:ATP-dependent Lhr-like helicase